MGRYNITVCHPTGNENVRAVISGLEQAGVLEKFYTTVGLTPGFNWQNKIELFFPEIKRRYYNPSLKTYIRCHPFYEIGRILSQKMHFSSLIKHESGIFSIDNIYRSLDRYVSKQLRGTSAIYSYEDGALYSFQSAKGRGIKCIYDLPIGYWRCMHQLLDEERERRPDWKSTLTGFNDSKEKLERKDEELQLADLILVASSFTKKTLDLYPHALAPVHVIPYGFPPIYLERKYGDHKKIKLLFVGSLSQRKGLADILEAVQGLDAFVDLTIIGQLVTKDCKPLNKALNSYRWIPSLSHQQILEEMRKHDVLLFPSLFEGFGLVITEAMSQGTPVITTDRTCGVDLIQNGINGWLVEVGNPLSLRSQIEKIIENPETISQCGRASLATASLRSWDDYGKDVSESIAHFFMS